MTIRGLSCEQFQVGQRFESGLRRTVTATLGEDDARFPKRVFIGDTLRAEVTVQSIWESQSHPEAGREFVHRCYNPRNVEVGQCKRLALKRKQPQEHA